jgi:F-type H+-transporting ATPase subunit a
MIVFVSNVLGLFMTVAATANLAINAGLAISCIMYVQWAGIKANGFFGHLKHFAGPKLGGPLVVLSALLFTVEIISESAKMVSLPFRLFMNIEGGHIVMKGFNGIIKVAGYEFPIGTFLLPIELLTAVIQAFIFTLLVSVYIGLVSHHEGEHDEAEEHDHLELPHSGEHALPNKA